MNIEFIEKHAKEIISSGQQHIPMIFLKLRDGKLCVYGLAFENNKEKNMMLEKFRKMIITKKVPQYWVVMEAWMNSNIHVMPSKDVNRTEALIISEFKETMERKCVIIPFERDGKKVIWKEKMDIQNDMDEQYHSWDFYREDVMEEITEKHRKDEMLKEIEEADFSKIIEDFKNKYKQDTGNDVPVDFDEKYVKKIIRKMIMDGKLAKKVDTKDLKEKFD